MFTPLSIVTRKALAYGFPQFAVESTEPVYAITVVFLQTGLHELQEPWLLGIVCCEHRKKTMLHLEKVQK